MSPALASRPVDQPPVIARVPPHRCVADEAVDHTRRVAAQAELLVARLEAVRALGTLTGEPRPLSAFVG